jgi:hypothetical protein
MAEKRPSDLRGQWDALKHEAVVLQAECTGGLSPGHPKVQEREAAIASLNARKDAVAHGAWMSTARDLTDLTLLAEVVFDYLWDIATFPQLPADIEDRDQQQIAVAYLVRGVLVVSQAMAETRCSPG